MNNIRRSDLRATLQGTPFHSRTAALCHSHQWQRWSGFLTAASYDLNPTWEYQAIRGAAALIDISPLYKYRIRGREAERLLNRLLTREVTACALNQVMYTTWCDDEGKVIDDGTLQRLGPRDFRLTAANPNLWWISQNSLGMDVELEDESHAIAALALQGPTSRDVLKQVCNIDLDALSYFWLGSGLIQDIPVTVTRTGFTGDLGYEIWLDRSQAEHLWDVLMSAGRTYDLRAAGMLALDLARIEAGLMLIGVDYISSHHAVTHSQKSSPFELGLGWTVDREKGYFIGRDALRSEQARPARWRLVGLEIDWPAIERLYREEGMAPEFPEVAQRESAPLYDDRRQIGYATSSCWSATLQKFIALATVEARYHRPGTRMLIETTVEHRRKKVPATVVKRPFFDPPRKRR